MEVSLKNYRQVLPVSVDFSITVLIPNRAPYFQTKIPGTVTLYKSRSPKEWSYSLPKVKDDNPGDSWTLSYDFGFAGGFLKLKGT